MRYPMSGRAALFVLIFSHRVFAEDDPYDRHFVLEGLLGVGTPLGFGGVGVEVAPIRWLGVNGGIGAGRFGAEGAFGLRSRYASKDFALGVGVGASVGPYENSVKPQIDGGSDYVKSYDQVWWLNGELFVERRGDGMLGWRLFAGAGHPTWMGASSCKGATDTDVAQCRESSPPSFLPYVGVSLELVPKN